MSAERFVVLVIEQVAEVDAEGQPFREPVGRRGIDDVVLRHDSAEDAGRPRKLIHPSIGQLRVGFVLTPRSSAQTQKSPRLISNTEPSRVVASI
jgi:hypothetical protein